MSRWLALLGMLLTLVVGSSGAVIAQGTPAAQESLLAGLGYPEVVVKATDAGLEFPADIQAGPILLGLENGASFPVGFSVIQLPEGTDLASLMPPPPAEGATPAAAEGEGGDEGFPPVFYDSVWAGGGFAMPGTTTWSVISLTPGEWLALTPPDVPFAPMPFTVAGEASDEVPAAEGSVAVELDNFQIRLPEVIPTGQSIWNVHSIGDQPHEIFIAQTPVRLAPEDAMTLLMLPEDGTPPPGLPSLEEIVQVGFVLPISKDQTNLVEMNLAPGHYLAVCFLPEKETGMPHAMKGMAVSFTVGAEGETVEPPASPVPEEHASH